MITILRAHGLRVVIYVDDHPPAHVHVLGDGEAIIDLIGPDGLPHLTWSKGLTRSQRRKALLAVRENQFELLDMWRQIHG